MITVLVQFQLGEDATLEKATETFQSTAPKYVDLHGLVRKYYIFDPATRRAGGCYLFPDRAAADAVLNEEWRQRVTEKYGGDPEITYFETPVIVDNKSHEVIGA